MNKINCIIVDDEPLALDLIESYVKKTPFLFLIARCSSALEALDIINKQKIDLVFLDIQMPDLTGMALSRTLKNDVKIIFTTAFSEYAIEGFKVNAVDYLLKPFNYEEFLKAALKAQDRIHSNETYLEKRLSDYIFIKSEYKQVKIQFDDILYIEGLKDYVKIWTRVRPAPYLTMMSLKVLEEQLPEAFFMRIHRSFIVSLDKIQLVDRSRVVFGQIRIPVADQYKDKFQEFINRKSITKA